MKNAPDFFTQSQYEHLIRNGHNRDKDHLPVAKIGFERAGCLWLLTELDPHDPLTAFGLSDLGIGHPELGYIDLAELAAIKLPAYVMLERDDCFSARYPISVYAAAARACGFITEDEAVLRRFAIPRRDARLRPV